MIRAISFEPRFSYIPLQMSGTISLIDAADSSRSDLKTLALKISAFAVIPLLAIALIELTLITPVRILVNVAIGAVNGAYYLIWGPHSAVALAFREKKPAAIVREIVRTIAETPTPLLATKAAYIFYLGDELEKQNVSPFQFLLEIFRQPDVVGQMNVIFNPPFTPDALNPKLIGFLSNMSGKFRKLQKLDQNEMEQQIKDFARQLRLPLETVRSYFHSEDWKGLIRFLIQRT